jgi:hypothetical protein
MDEYLVEYLLETLDPVTRQRVEVWLRTHPEGRDRLELLRQALEPLAEDAGDVEPPPGLAVAALARVAEHRCLLPRAPAASPSQSEFPPRRGWRRIDGMVAACLLVLVAGLALPAVIAGWRQQRRLACADNLRRFHAGLMAYSEEHAGAFPRVEPDGPHSIAGIFVPLLNDAGLAQDVSIACPAHERRRPLPYRVADLEGLYRDNPVRFQAVASELAGHYAYCLGYEQDGQLCGLRRDTGDLLPILADRGSADASNSANHAGAGQNVLFIGGHVRWCAQPTAGVDNDHIYVNKRQRIGAGISRIDTVLGSSDARPFQ